MSCRTAAAALLVPLTLAALVTVSSPAWADGAQDLLGKLERGNQEERCQAAAALSDARDAAAVKPLIQALTHKDQPTRDAVVAALEAIGEPSVAPLIEGLGHSSARVRHGAAVALARIGDGRAVAPLADLLADGEIKVRTIAAWALGNFKDPMAAAALAGALDEPGSHFIGDRPRKALLEIGPGAVDALIRALRSERDNARITAADLLGHFEDERAVPGLATLARDDPAEKVRLHAAVALGKFNSRAAEEALVHALLEDRAPRVRLKALQRLQEYARKRPGDPREAARPGPAGAERTSATGKHRLRELWYGRALLRARCDPDEKVRQRARSSSFMHKSEQFIADAVAASSDADPCLRMQALEVLQERRVTGRPEAVVAAVAALEAEDAESRQAAAEVLSQAQDPRSTERLIAALQDPDATVRRLAAQTLGRIFDRKAIPALERAADDPEPRVREAAKRALKRFESNEEPPEKKRIVRPAWKPRERPGVPDERLSAWELRERLTERRAAKAEGRRREDLLVDLKSGRAEARLQAAEALVHHKDRRALAPLLELLGHASAEMRFGAAQSLAGLKRTEAVEPLLERMAEDDDGKVRAMAAYALGTIGAYSFGDFVEPEVIEALLDAMRDPERIVAHHAGYALWRSLRNTPELWPSDAVPELAGVLRSAKSDFHLRQEMLDGLAKTGSFWALEPIYESRRDLHRGTQVRADNSLAELTASMPNPWQTLLALTAVGLLGLALGQAARRRRLEPDRRVLVAYWVVGLGAVLWGGRVGLAVARVMSGDVDGMWFGTEAATAIVLIIAGVVHLSSGLIGLRPGNEDATEKDAARYRNAAVLGIAALLLLCWRVGIGWLGD